MKNRGAMEVVAAKRSREREIRRTFWIIEEEAQNMDFKL